MKTGFTTKKYNALFVASLLGWVVSLVGGMADSIIAGLSLGADAVSAVGLVVPMYQLEMFVALMMAFGIAIRYSTELGAFNIEKSHKIAGMGLIVAVCTGLCLGGLMLLVKPLFLSFYDCSESIISQASAYYNMITIVAVIDPIFYSIYYLIVYDGDEKVALACDIEIALLNTVFSAILVRKFGVIGLGLGTIIAELISFLIMFTHFLSKKNSIKFKLYFSFKDLRAGIRQSSALSLSYMYTAVVDIIMNKVIIMFFGDIYLPAYTVVNAVINFAAIFACAGNSGGCLITIAYGEGNYNAVRRVEKRVFKYSIITAVLFSALILSISSLWPTIYGIADPAIAEAAIYAGRVIPAFYLLFAVSYDLLEYYPLVNKPIEGNMLSIGLALIFPLLLSIPLGKYGGFNGMCWGFALTPLACLVVLFIYMLCTKQLKKAPLLLPDMKEEELQFELALNPESIEEARDKAEEFLKKRNVPSGTIMKIQIMIEDSLNKIKDKNKKKTLCECVLLADDKHVRLITKDNGKIFDITKEADDSLDLSSYVLARVMGTTTDTLYTTTSSFNRNTYTWEV